MDLLVKKTLIVLLAMTAGASAFLGKQPPRSFAMIPEARITVYWQDSDQNTRHLLSASGVTLQKGHVAVDPQLIPYGSRLRIQGWGEFVAVDTGRAVKSRQAARKCGKDCPVVDVFFYDRREALRAAAMNPAFTRVEIVSLPAGNG